MYMYISLLFICKYWHRCKANWKCRGHVWSAAEKFLVDGFNVVYAEENFFKSVYFNWLACFQGYIIFRPCYQTFPTVSVHVKISNIIYSLSFSWSCQAFHLVVNLHLTKVHLASWVILLALFWWCTSRGNVRVPCSLRLYAHSQNPEIVFQSD